MGANKVSQTCSQNLALKILLGVGGFTSRIPIYTYLVFYKSNSYVLIWSFNSLQKLTTNSLEVLELICVMAGITAGSCTIFEHFVKIYNLQLHVLDIWYKLGPGKRLLWACIWNIYFRAAGAQIIFAGKRKVLTRWRSGLLMDSSEHRWWEPLSLWRQLEV